MSADFGRMIERKRLEEAIADARKRQAGGDSYLTLLADAAEADDADATAAQLTLQRVDVVGDALHPAFLAAAHGRFADRHWKLADPGERVEWVNRQSGGSRRVCRDGRGSGGWRGCSSSGRWAGRWRW